MYARTYRRRIFVSAWPISLIATASDTPPASGSVAAPCRSPWKVIPANPCVAANLRQPVENDARSQGPPIPLSTTSSGCSPIASNLVAWAARWRRSALFTETGSARSRSPADDFGGSKVDLAGCVGQRPPYMHGTVHVVPAERQHFLASEPEPERQVDGDVPRNLSLDRLEDPHRFRSTDHVERRPVPHRTVHELRRGGSSAGSPCGACTTTGKKRGHGTH